MDARYRERCLRALGIMNERQLEEIRRKRIAVGGLGLGGSVFLNLVRMGFEKFHIADPDVYERTNINRQRQAKETTVGSRKDDCLIQEARSINPEVEIVAFRDGVNAANVGEFLRGVDWVVDSIDVFAMAEKLALHEAARARGLPVASCVALGFGAAVVVFTAESPGFAELSGMSVGKSYAENIASFARFVTPEIPGYMARQLDLALQGKGHIPFIVPGVEISAALVATEIGKHLLGLGDRAVAPRGIYLDPVELRIEKFLADHRAREEKQAA